MQISDVGNAPSFAATATEMLAYSVLPAHVTFRRKDKTTTKIVAVMINGIRVNPTCELID